MSAITYTSFISAFIKRNWFQIAIVLLVLYVFLKKDFSFSFNLNAPSKTEKIQPLQKKKVMTDAFSKENKSHNKLNILPGEGAAVSNSLSRIKEETKVNYLKRFAHVAIDEKDKYQIPASIILASAILHSKAGTADFTTNGNNQFAITCNDWSGETNYVKNDCYRKYNSAWLSFRNHSEYITSGKFERLKKLDAKAYKKWAKGLEELNFSNERDLAFQLINIIERYKLYEID